MEKYEGDYQCAVSEDGSCRKVATQCWREPFTPSAFPVIACDEHADGLRAEGYHFDQDATIQLLRDVEREEEREAVR
jgi:hypothetical protein